MSTKSAVNESYTKFAAETAFFIFVRRYVLHARDLARSGQKDHARDWYRFFTNAQVISMLSSHSAIKDSSLRELAGAISKLGNECHPDDVPDWKTDIQAIRHSLEQILKRLPEKAPVHYRNFDDPKNWRTVNEWENQ